MRSQVLKGFSMIHPYNYNNIDIGWIFPFVFLGKFPKIQDVSVYKKGDILLGTLNYRDKVVPHRFLDIMDQRLFKASKLGDVVAFNILLEEDPLILERLSLSLATENPLHIAALSGQTDFAKEMIRMMPSFAWELNQDGFSPMHMASARGNIEIVRGLLTLGPDLCSVRDKGGRTPLHHAAFRGRVHVIEELLSHCLEAIEIVTVRGETALHLAVKYNQFEALTVLVERLENMDNHYRELINAKDEEGNTILELATSTDQLQVVEFLCGRQSLLGLLQVSIATANVNNQIQEIVEVLTPDQTAGGIGMETMSQASLSDVGIRVSHPEAPSQQPDQSPQKLHKEYGDGDMGSLTVAIGILVLSFQALLNPPSYIWKEGMEVDFKCIYGFHTPVERCSGTAYYYSFMTVNTFMFCDSLACIIRHLGRPLGAHTAELTSCLLVTELAYLSLVDAMLPNSSFWSVLSISLPVYVHIFEFLILEIYSRPIRKIGISVKTIFNRMRKRPPVDVPRVDL